ncbi:MAG: hypothetical protein Q8P12_06680, partial [bacterium]|nr:hypothetical protein [bacterium]
MLLAVEESTAVSAPAPAPLSPANPVIVPQVVFSEVQEPAVEYLLDEKARPGEEQWIGPEEAEQINGAVESRDGSWQEEGLTESEGVAAQSAFEGSGDVFTPEAEQAMEPVGAEGAEAGSPERKEK